MALRIACRTLLATTILWSLGAVAVRSDSFLWTGGGTNPNWDNQLGLLYGNWGTLALPSAANDVIFGALLTSGNPSLNGNRTINSLSTSSSPTFNLTGNPGDTLSLASGNLTQTSGGGLATIGVPIVLQANGTWNVQGGGVVANGSVTDGGTPHAIEKTGSGSLTFGGASNSVQGLAIDSGSVTLSSGTLTLSNSIQTALALAVGKGTSSAAFTVQAGATLNMTAANMATISGVAGTPTVMNVTGANTKWLMPFQANIGNLGSGKLVIDNGAVASGSQAVFVGDLNDGALNIQGGGTLSDFISYIGLSSQGPGMANVTGAGSLWSMSSDLGLGNNGGSGSLTIANQGGVVVGGVTNIYDGGSITVNGGHLTTALLGGGGGSGSISLTDFGNTPALTINGGSDSATFGGVISGTGTLRKVGGSNQILSGANTFTGQTRIDGGSISLANSLALQNSLVALNVNNGLLLDGLNAVTIGELLGTGDFDFGSATFTVGDNGTNFVYQGNLHGSGTLIKQGSNGMVLTGANNFVGVANINAGAITVNGGLQGLGVFVNSGGKLKGAGTIVGGIVVNSGGVLAPGDSFGILGTQNLFMTSGAVLNLEIGGTARGVNYDALDATGSVSLAGTMTVSLDGGFVPALGSQFDVLDWGTLSGTFSSLSLPTLAGGLGWNTSQLYTTGVLRIILLGDYNQNGIVDASDYVVWRKGRGTIYTQNDYNVWRAHFGQTAGSGAGTIENSTVPEPATLVPLMFAAIGWCLRRARAT